LLFKNSFLLKVDMPLFFKDIENRSLKNLFEFSLQLYNQQLERNDYRCLSSFLKSCRSSLAKLHLELQKCNSSITTLSTSDESLSGISIPPST
jgi:hypothetical protein